MKQVFLPFNAAPFQNAEAFALNQLSESLFDGFIIKLESDDLTVKRPGMETLVRLGTAKPIDGVYWWEKQQLLISVSDGRIFKTTSATGTTIEITGDKLETSGRPTFTDNGTTLVIANGGRMVFTDGTTPTTFIADPDAPTEVSHVAFLDQFILANEVGTGRFHFADFVGPPTTWFQIDVFTAESSPDDLLALYVNRQAIILLGSESVEFWFNDGITPFTRSQGAIHSRGVISPFATVIANEVLYWIDDRRRLVRLEGTEPVILSTPFDKIIQNFATINDAVMDYTTVDGRHFILISFPTEDRTLMYDLQGNYWTEWSFFNVGISARQRFLGQAYTYARGFNQHIFASKNDDRLLEMRSNIFDDDGADIHMTRTTGFLDHNTPDKRKRSYRINMRVQTGIGLPPTGSVQPFLLIRSQDSDEPTFNAFRYIPLGVQGQTDFMVTIRNNGNYFARRYEIKMTEKVPFAVGRTVEEIDISDV